MTYNKSDLIILDIRSIWILEVIEKLRKGSPLQYNDLNPSCTEIDLLLLEKQLNLSLPENLKAIYLENDGQKGDAPGIFRGIPPGSDSRFLPLKKVVQVWQELNDDKDLNVFKPLLVPFATDSIYDVYCVDSSTEIVYLLWTGGPDWTLPRDWQIDLQKKAENLIEFVKDFINVQIPAHYFTPHSEREGPYSWKFYKHS